MKTTQHTIQKPFRLLPQSPALRFVIMMIIGMVLFYIFYKSAYYQNYLNEPIVSAQANITSFFLNLFGADTISNVTVISSATTNSSINIKGGCDGLEATALLLCAVSVFPIAFKYKVPGLFMGFLGLFVLNIFRLVGLFYAKTYASQTTFDLLHEQGGFVIFTALSIVIWMIWANWAMKKASSDYNAKA
jgi:exosortase/archaeosortase family protein